MPPCLLDLSVFFTFVRTPFIDEGKEGVSRRRLIYIFFAVLSFLKTFQHLQFPLKVGRFLFFLFLPVFSLCLLSCYYYRAFRPTNVQLSFAHRPLLLSRQLKTSSIPQLLYRWREGGRKADGEEGKQTTTTENTRNQTERRGRGCMERERERGRGPSRKTSHCLSLSL